VSGINLAEHTTKFGGKPYVMVSGRVLLAHEANDELSITTDIVGMTEDYVIVKASVSTMKGVFTGHATSYTRTGSPQERKTPLEVAETSAIGRALGFAGYALEHGIASADEMSRVQPSSEPPPPPRQEARKPIPKAPIRRHTGDASPDNHGGPIPTPSELLERWGAALEGATDDQKAQLRTWWREQGIRVREFDELAPAVQWRAVEMLEGIRAGEES
jgi:hypothetical protein